MPTGGKVWLALGHTDMRRGMRSLALQVQQSLKKDVHAGDLYVFRGKNGSLCKILWHDGIGMSLYAKRLEKGRFVWPAAKDGTVAISASAMASLLEGIDWRNPQGNLATNPGRLIAWAAAKSRKSWGLCRSCAMKRHGYRRGIQRA